MAERKATHLKIGGTIRLYTDKEGFTCSGESILGALEFHPESDTMKCHECGGWYKSLASHVPQKHHMTAERYKEKHGLRQGTALVSEEIRVKNIKTALKYKPWEHSTAVQERRMSDAKKKRRKKKMRTAEILNRADSCHKQLLLRLKNLGQKLGRTPTHIEMVAAGLGRQALAWRYGSVRHALRLAGFEPRRTGRPDGSGGSLPIYTDEHLLATIKTFFRLHGRVPSHSDCRRGLLPAHTTFVRRFGGFGKAVKAAGFRPNPTGWHVALVRRGVRKEIAA